MYMETLKEKNHIIESYNDNGFRFGNEKSKNPIETYIDYKRH